MIREYRINVTEIETGDLRQFTTLPDVRELVVGPLHPYYSYRSTIVAFTIEVGPYSTAITVRTEEDGERESLRRRRGWREEREKGRKGGREWGRERERDGARSYKDHEVAITLLPATMKCILVAILVTRL